MYKLNIDSAYEINSNIGGARRIIRDSNEKWIEGFSSHISPNKAIHAELLALLKG